MKIIVETSIWSLAFRRKNDLQNPNVRELYTYNFTILFMEIDSS